MEVIVGGIYFMYKYKKGTQKCYNSKIFIKNIKQET